MCRDRIEHIYIHVTRELNGPFDIIVCWILEYLQYYGMKRIVALLYI